MSTKPGADTPVDDATSSVSAREQARSPLAAIDFVKEGAAAALHEAITEGVDVNAQDAHGMTALHHAAALDARPCIRVLVRSGKCDFLVRDKQGRYATDLAVLWGRDPGVAELLAKHQARQAFERGVPGWVPPDALT